MKTRLLALIAILSISAYASAQAPIVRQNGTALGFYNNVPAAVTAASNGDTLYIPGGSWALGSPQLISKTIHIIGVGFGPDSAQGSGITFLTGSLFLVTGASNGSLTGVHLQNNITCNNYIPDSVTNYSITRCRVDGSVAFSNHCANWLLSGNYFASIVQIANDNSTFTNNIFGERLFNSSNCFFRNNIFLWTGGGAPVLGSSLINNCVFENNIFIASANTIFGPGVLSSIFNNNLFVENISFPVGSNLGSSNIPSQTQNLIFINQTGNTFSYSHDYHLQSTSLGHNAGTDGTDVGVYGGVFPWKDGSLPSNPHVVFKSIQGNTDQNGNLQINIKVKAQNN
jgi:hypothetical protein